MCAFRAVPLLPRLTGSHPLTLQFALKTSAEVQRPIPTFLSLFFTFNGDVLHDLFKWQTSPVSLFLSWGISHWVLMSDYFTSHSALDKWLRRAVKNRSKPLGWERGGRRREAVKSPPPPSSSAARQAAENATHYSCARANQGFRVIREQQQLLLPPP